MRRLFAFRLLLLRLGPFSLGRFLRRGPGSPSRVFSRMSCQRLGAFEVLLFSSRLSLDLLPPQRQFQLSSTRADENAQRSRSCSVRSRICFCKLTVSPVVKRGSFIRPSAIWSWRRKAAWRSPFHQPWATSRPFGGIFWSSQEETSPSSPGLRLDMNAFSDAGSSG